jgi:type I restriction enzyme S subunit
VSEWKKATIGDVLTLQRGFDITRADQRAGSIPVVSSGGIGSYHDTAAVHGPGVVIGRKGTLGKTFYLPGEYWPHDTTLWVKDFKGNHPRFVYYFFLNLDVMGLDVGSANPTLNRNHVHPLPVRWPGPDEQTQIAGLLSALDDKIAVNDRIVSAALALGDASFKMTQASIVRRSMLGELATEKTLIFGDGYRTKRNEHGQPGLPILRVAEVKDGRIEPEFVDFVSDSYRPAMGGKVSHAGDVILTTKGTVGRVAAITAKDPLFVYSPQLCYFRVLTDSPLSSSYVYFWLRSSDFWRQAETRKSQTDMADYLSLTDIRKMTIPMPTPGSNQQWPPKLNSLLAEISARHEENKALVELRDTLLPRLMSGEIRVRDAEKVVEDVT